MIWCTQITTNLTYLNSGNRQFAGKHANTTYDYSWVIRRYLNYLRVIGKTDVTFIKQTNLAAFILSCAREVTRGSMRYILSYTKRFHEFFRDTERLEIPFEGLFTVSVFREKKIQQLLSTDELNRILVQIDLTKTKGKRNLAIILLGAELGLRASDIINLKLNDVDWLRKELRIQQQKIDKGIYYPKICSLHEWDRRSRLCAAGENVWK